MEKTNFQYKDIIFFSDDVGTIYSINKGGKLIWKRNIYRKIYKNIYKNLTLSIYKDRIYVSDNIGFIYSINFKNGKIIWIKYHGVPLKSKIKLFDDKIFLINQENRVISLDINNGAKVWDVRAISSFIKSQNFLSIAISKKSEVIALTSSGDLIKIDSKTGKVYWSLNIVGSVQGSETDFFESSEIVISGEDMIFSSLSSIFSFNLSNGYLNWQ